jgi:hypothetical protein
MERQPLEKRGEEYEAIKKKLQVVLLKNYTNNFHK